MLRGARGNWSTAKVESALAANQTLYVKLIEPLRVTIFYSTAAASESKGVEFYEDLYGHDRALQTKLGELRP